MIIDFILSLLIGMLDIAFALLPPWNTDELLYNTPTIDVTVTDPGTGFDINANPLWAVIGMAAKMNYFLPIDHFFVILGVSALTFLTVLGYKFVRILIGTVRGAGTS